MLSLLAQEQEREAHKMLYLSDKLVDLRMNSVHLLTFVQAEAASTVYRTL
jgi:hypothetical protein